MVTHSSSSSLIGSDEAEPGAGQRGTQPDAAQEEGHQQALEQVAQLSQSIRRGCQLVELP